MNILKLCRYSLLILSLIGLNACTSTRTQESTGEFIDSSRITASVKSELLGDPITSPFRIKVNTFKNVVQLSGFVNSEEEKARAGAIASKVEGVSRVKNDLIIK